MGFMSQALATEETISFPLDEKGQRTPATKDYKLSQVTTEIMAYCEQWLEDQAWEKLSAARDRAVSKAPLTQQPVVDAQYRSREDRLLASIAAGEFSFWSEPMQRAIGRIGGPGYKHMLTLRLKAVNDPGTITDGLVNEMIEQQAEQISFLFRKMDTPDPNSPTPAAGPGESSESKASSPS